LRDVKDVVAVNHRTFVVTFEGEMEGRAGLLTSVQGLGLKVTGFSSVGLPLEMMYMDLVKDSR
jgi:hypothetical protein